MLNLEDFVARLEEYLQGKPPAGSQPAGGSWHQTLWQYDNWTDTVCFEPEYGGAKLLVEYFARQPGKYLELYVGKSDNVDFLLSLDHRGHTIPCWSVSGPTQSARIERGAAPMARRIEAARKCQQAGYRVRFRFSPIIPVKNWETENREMIERVFAETRPDLITFEPLRFLDFAAIQECLDVSLLAPEFLEVMKSTQGQPHCQGGEIPDDYRKKISRFIIDEVERLSPGTPYAYCRESRDLWDSFAPDFSRRGQSPDHYVCNCGPTSAPGNPLLGGP